MSKNFKLFLTSFIFVMFFCFIINIFQSNLENFLISKKLEKNPPLPVSELLANISYNPSEKTELEISAKSAISMVINEKGEEKIIFKKNENEKMEIASLTKLMTAVIASEFYKPDLEITITKEAIDQPESFGGLKLGEKLNAQELIYFMLIESSNDAAFALTIPLKTPESFVGLMNLKAKELKMEKSSFFNPTGLDGENTYSSNFSTVSDLAKLAKYIINKPLILDIISKKEYSINGHTLHNTNQLLGENPEIIGGKTGFTDEAGECLVLILKNKEKEIYTLNVILGSENRYQDMEKLIDYGYAKYKYN